MYDQAEQARRQKERAVEIHDALAAFDPNHPDAQE